MKHGWLASALVVGGLAVVALATWRGALWAVAAGAGGVTAGVGLGLPSVLALRRAGRAGVRPSDFAHTLDLVRRAHGGLAGWAVGLREGEVEVVGGGDVREGRRRGAAIVQLASVDGRTHVAREPEGTYVAAGDFPYGAGLLLGAVNASPETADGVTDDLRRLLASMRLAELEAPGGGGHGELVARQLRAIAAGAQTLEGIARAGAELAQQLAHRGAVVAMLDAAARGAHVVAASSSADRRLEGATLAPESDAVRAIQSALPIVTHGGEDVFGPGVPERRRRDRAGTAYPLLDGHVALGALVLMGPPLDATGAVAEQIGRLLMELGPRLAAARAVHHAEQRAIVDPLTGLRNRREFERVLDQFRAQSERVREPATLIYADLDHFKSLNDTLGHAAGDAALRHVAGVLQAQIRDGDLVARIGGEEFAVWLPRTPLAVGLEVAERIRQAVHDAGWRWNGNPYPLSTSCGVAAYPEGVRDVNNLRGAADAALYRAKQAGRNRVEKAVESD